MNDQQTLIDLVSTLEIDQAAVAGNLALLPLIARRHVAADPLHYFLYQQAQDAGLVSIEEVSTAGSVGTLRVANRADRPVLLVEGEVLLGMKQTRVLNLTILVPATSVLNVPVSCVESGRWQSVSEEATGKAAVNLAPSVRAAKTVTVARSMRSARSFASDQQAVWAGVDRILDGHSADVPSRSYADLAARGSRPLTGVAATVEPAPGQVGVIACVAGRVACADIFEAPEVLASMWSGLVASYQAEAAMSDTKPLGARADATARRWFRSIAAGSPCVGPELGVGSHLTVVAPDLEAAALVHEGRVVHLSAFPAHQSASPTRFVSPAQRRN
jgi:hypothetical protein